MRVFQTCCDDNDDDGRSFARESLRPEGGGGVTTREGGNLEGDQLLSGGFWELGLVWVSLRPSLDGWI